VGVTGLLGIVGGALIWAAARFAPRSPRVAYLLLLAGALPFAAATWWSVVTTIVAVLAVVLGLGVIRDRGAPRTWPDTAATGAVGLWCDMRENTDERATSPRDGGRR
jgi:hypothetical protein